MKKNIYEHFNRFLLRFPTYSLQKFFSYIKEEQDLLELFHNDKIFRSAVLNASPDLHYQARDLELTDKKSEKIKLSLYKYFSRMCSRSTPFGLFAGVTVGRVSKNTNFVINDQDIVFSFKYNNLFLYNHLYKNVKLSKEDIMLYPNNTVTKFNRKYQYVEDTSNELTGEKNFRLIKVDCDQILKMIYEKSKKGILKSILIGDLIELGYSAEDSTNYILELIDNRFLMSEVELDLHTSYFEKLSGYVEKSQKNIDSTRIYSDLKKVSLKKHENVEYIYDLINSINERYELPSNINPINYSSTILNNSVTLDLNIMYKIQNIIPFLFKVSNISTNENISNFSKKFYERYEFQKVPLLEALDGETGLDYPHSTIIPLKNKYIENLKGYGLFQNNKGGETIVLNDTLKRINSKIIEAIANNRRIIQLNDRDFPDKVLDYEKFPKTVYGLAKLFVENGNEKICINGIGGPSALNLMSRFTSQNSEIQALVSEIFNAEKLINQKQNANRNTNVILAEISFVPDINVSNVLGHPHIFDYYIPILGFPEKKAVSTPIFLDDLYLYLNTDRKIILWSKKLNAEIQPILTNPHNYHKSDLNIYKFLAELKGQNEIGYFGFSIGSIDKLYKHVPRFEYNNIVLFEERWFLEKKDIKALKNAQNFDELHKEILTFRHLHKIPQNVILVHGDNELLVDFRDEFSIKSFIKEAMRSSRIELKEFLCTESLLMNRKNENFSHEIVIPFFKNEH